MGLLSGFRSREDMVNTILERYKQSKSWEILDHKSTRFGKHLWALVKHEDHASFIVLFKLGSSYGDWYYKTIDEQMGPYAIDCPVSLIDKAGPACNEMSEKWRRRVRLRANKQRNLKLSR